jgi:hypothetical protein
MELPAQELANPSAAPPVRLEALPGQSYSFGMSETYQCPHCGALYEVIHEDTTAPGEDAANCQVCGKALPTGSGDRRYELIRMPDGTNV